VSAKLTYWRKIVLLAIAVCYPFAGMAQNSSTTNPTTSDSTPSTQSHPEQKTPSGQATSAVSDAPIRLNVNLVVVPVVVRDSRGHPVADLQRENFEVRDNHKPQSIVQFSLEQSDQERSANEGERSWAGKFVMPSRFTVLLFDDVHLDNETFPAVRTSIIRRFNETVSPYERIAIFTTSGKVTLDFTDDRAKLIDALNRLQWNPLPNSQIRDCLNMTHEEANEIVNRHDVSTKEDLVARAMGSCSFRDPVAAERFVMATSEQVLYLGDASTKQLLEAVKVVVGRLSRAPGAKNIVLISPGFLISDFQHAESDVINLALRNHVIISSIDARGLSTAYENVEDSNPLAEFADGTGGLFYRNSNDFGKGTREISETPVCVYFLGFSPSDLKSNGAFHRIDVKVVGRTELAAKWRRGYFAPKGRENSKNSKDFDIGPIVFSREVIRGLPIEMRVQFVQDDKAVAKLTVTTFVDLHQFPVQESDVHNEELLRVVAAVFDRNGIYLGSSNRIAHLRPRKNASESYNAAKFDFIVDSGNYLVRLVVCNSQTGQIYADNSVVQIP
jgi:VWFA-related protein